MPHKSFLAELNQCLPRVDNVSTRLNVARQATDRGESQLKARVVDILVCTCQEPPCVATFHKVDTLWRTKYEVVLVLHSCDVGMGSAVSAVKRSLSLQLDIPRPVKMSADAFGSVHIFPRIQNPVRKTSMRRDGRLASTELGLGAEREHPVCASTTPILASEAAL